MSMEYISIHLTNNYVSQKLTEWFGEEVIYTGYKSEKGTGKGDSYLSDIYRIKILGKKHATSETLSLQTIIKTIPKNVATRKTFRSVGFFKNEIDFYLKVMPVLLKFQSEKKLNEPFECIPKVFAAITDGKNDFLILEDLSIYDFGPAIRQEGIDYDHCIFALECFAKFHALSFAFKDQHPEKFEMLRKNVQEMYYHERHWNWYKDFYVSMCRCAIDAVEKEYPNTIYSNKVKEFATEKTFKRLSAATEYTETGVFSHGDSWTPNFLFKYKPGNNKPVEAKMIDFQLTRCASPYLDISFFIYACTTEDLRKEHYDNILKFYHDTLSFQIKELGSDPTKVYSWNTFMDEVKKYSFFGLAFSMESVPVIILDPEDAFNMDLTGTEAVNIASIWTIKPIKTKAGRLRLANNFKHAVDNGYI